MSADGAVLTVISGSQPNISRWHLEGIGLGRRLIARGQMLAGPYSYEAASVATAPPVDAPTPGVEIGRIMKGVLEGVVVVDTATGRVTYRFDDPVSDVGWARDRRLYARSEAGGLFRIIDADTSEVVGGPISGVTTLSALHRRLQTPRGEGRCFNPKEIDPQTGEAEGEAWRIDGFPVWISVAPGGDRIAVTHQSVAWGSPRGESSLAILSAEDHHLLYDEPVEVEAHVMLENSELIGLESTRIGGVPRRIRSLVTERVPATGSWTTVAQS